jgi:UDP-glucuronate 4-epimerase
VRVLVTGVAGFIGSTLADSLLAQDFDVVGVDSFTSYYERERKERNIERCRDYDRFSLVELDLRTEDLSHIVDDVEVVFHLAGQPGVRLSWSESFADYESNNVLATQRLLEAVRERPVRRFVFASSSSVYGDRAPAPTTEEALPRPHSPYGVTKLAAEHLCTLYADNWDVPTVALRYFTVYGPRQRPDMAMARLIRAALNDEAFELLGDGRQVRDFTYVTDVVSANLRAAETELQPGEVLNVAGGGSTTMLEVIDLIRSALERPLEIETRPAQAGDVQRTGGDTSRTRDLLGWEPLVDLRSGVNAQIEWTLQESASDASS